MIELNLREKYFPYDVTSDDPTSCSVFDTNRRFNAVSIKFNWKITEITLKSRDLVWFDFIFFDAGKVIKRFGGNCGKPSSLNFWRPLNFFKDTKHFQADTRPSLDLFLLPCRYKPPFRFFYDFPRHAKLLITYSCLFHGRMQWLTQIMTLRMKINMKNVSLRSAVLQVSDLKVARSMSFIDILNVLWKWTWTWGIVNLLQCKFLCCRIPYWSELFSKSRHS